MFDPEILECLRNIERSLDSDKYEHLGVWTIGGPNNNYILKSPVNTESEWALFGASFTAAGNILVSHNPASNTLATNGSVAYGGTTSNEGNPIDGLFITAAAAATFVPVTDLFWQPTGRGSSVYVLVSGVAGGQSAFALVAWRRLLNREIPMPPRRPPTTHTTRLSTRAQRVLPAMSEETAGAIEGRTVLPGDGPYRHIVTPSHADQAAIERGISRPLTRGEIMLAKMRGQSGADK